MGCYERTQKQILPPIKIQELPQYQVVPFKSYRPLKLEIKFCFLKIIFLHQNVIIKSATFVVNIFFSNPSRITEREKAESSFSLNIYSMSQD